MLRAELYNYSGEVNKIQKSLGSVIYSVPFTFLDNYDLQTPHIVLTLAGNDANGTAMQAYMAFQINYIVIYDSDNAAFRKQYYFVDKVVWQTNELLEFVLRKDVLMSYATSIINLAGYLDRCEDKEHQDLDVKDELFSFENTFYTDQVLLGTIPSASPLTLFIVTIQNVFNPIEASIGQPAPSFSGNVFDYSFTRKGYNKTTTVTAVEFLSLNNMSSYLNNLATKIYELNETVRSYILGIYISPFPIDTMGLQTYGIDSASAGAFYCGDDIVDPGSLGTAYFFSDYDSTNEYVHIRNLYEDIVSSPIARYYNDFRDFEPYTKIYLHIPFYGEYQVDPSVVYTKKSDGDANYNFVFRYCFDFVSSNSYCIVLLDRGGEMVVLATLKCNALTIVNINSSTNETTRAQNVNILLSTIAGAISGLASGAGAAVVTDNPAAAAGGVAGAGAAILKGIGQAAVNIQKGLTYSSTDDSYTTGFCTNLRCLSMCRFRSKVVESLTSDGGIGNFSHLFGRPSKRYVVISILTSGYYIKYSEIHADIPYATSQEKEEIERLLMSGVYK